MLSYLRSALFLGLLTTGVVGAATPPIPPPAILEHIKFLASDDLQGRGNGTEELERAADYIAAQFKAAGLRPGGQDGGWFQPFGLTAGLNIDEGNSLVIRVGTQSVRLTLGESYYPLAATPTNGTPAARYINALNGPAQGYVDHGPGVVSKRWSSLSTPERKAQARRDLLMFSPRAALGLSPS